jgi:hypothetical protein
MYDVNNNRNYSLKMLGNYQKHYGPISLSQLFKKFLRTS